MRQSELNGEGCYACKFSAGYGQSVNGEMVCVRHAPSPKIFLKECEQGGLFPIYPIVIGDDWCGEYQYDGVTKLAIVAEDD